MFHEFLSNFIFYNFFGYNLVWNFFSKDNLKNSWPDLKAMDTLRNKAILKVRSHCEGNGNDFVAYLFIGSGFSMAMETQYCFPSGGVHMVTDGNDNGKSCMYVYLELFLSIAVAVTNGSTTHLPITPLSLPSVTMWAPPFVCIQQIHEGKKYWISVSVAVAVTVWTNL